LPNPKQIKHNLERVFSNKYFRVFKKETCLHRLEISISKKYFKLAVERNLYKRRVKEILRKNSFDDFLERGYVFSVFRPFAELSYAQAEKEITIAIKAVTKE
tara:strand:- start:314 stop:619 length:306 start_codon:yes stop_codon:yes gene_type:complete